MDNEWEANPNWRNLVLPRVGDMVQLKNVADFAYRVNCIVSSVSDDEITGVADAVFDWQTKAVLTGGKNLDIVGKQVTFERRMIHKVIKKKTA